MIGEVWAAAAPIVKEYTATDEAQFLLLVIQALWTIVLIVVGVVLRMIWSAIKEQGALTAKLHERLLTDYATKKELVERSHGLRDSLGVHSTWIHLIAMKCGMDLPSMSKLKDKDDSNL